MNNRGFCAIVVLCAVQLLGTLNTWAAVRFKVLHAFQDHPAAGPCSTLIADSKGNLYGTTCSDAAHGAGVVYELSPTSSGEEWTYHILHIFNISDGQFPTGKLLLDGKGNLYGTTYQGGHNYNGVVYELMPDVGGRWKSKTLHYFNFNDGAGSIGGLAMDAQGVLYGATHNGGKYDEGVAYMLSPGANGKWTETVLHDFSDSEGVGVQTGLTFDTLGNLYGATESEVFVLKRNSQGDWTESIAYAFGPSDGGNIYGDLVFDQQGNLYGSNMGGGVDGGGTVFKLTQDSKGEWVSTILTSFSNTKGWAGYGPYSGLALYSDGSVYGTTCAGGLYGLGVLFKLVPQDNGKWTLKLIHPFTGGRDGGGPGGVILDNSGNLFGVANVVGLGSCGNGNSLGVVFEASPAETQAEPK
jgi:uncharacterized repeat protein (TIGR03803 family)